MPPSLLCLSFTLLPRPHPELTCPTVPPSLLQNPPLLISATYPATEFHSPLQNPCLHTVPPNIFQSRPSPQRAPSSSPPHINHLSPSRSLNEPHSPHMFLPLASNLRHFLLYQSLIPECFPFHWPPISRVFFLPLTTETRAIILPFITDPGIFFSLRVLSH